MLSPVTSLEDTNSQNVLTYKEKLKIMLQNETFT